MQDKVYKLRNFFHDHNAVRLLMGGMVIKPNEYYVSNHGQTLYDDGNFRANLFLLTTSITGTISIGKNDIIVLNDHYFESAFISLKNNKVIKLQAYKIK